jgi:hypothetical protein
VGRRALLIGCPGGSLPQAPLLVGVPRDLDVMTDLLSGTGFEVRSPPTSSTTRQQILRCYRELIEDTADGDDVVVYICGHGGSVGQDPAKPAPGAPEVYQFFLTADIAESTSGDFRGITALEWSALQHELNDHAANITTIIDTCYAGRLSRDPALVPRGLLGLAHANIAAHLAALDPRVVDLARREPAGSSRAVRLVACAAEGQAYEKDLAHGIGGVFTTVLTNVLAATLDTPLSWSMIMDDVRHRIGILGIGQRPEAEGPAGRLPFSLDTRPDGALRVTATRHRDGPCVLAGGTIAGVTVGDVYAAMPPGARRGREDQALGIVTVGADARIHLTETTAALAFRRGVTSLPAGALAHPLEKGLTRYPVTVTATDPAGEAGAAAVRVALDAASHVRPVTSADDRPLAAVEVSAGCAAVVSGDTVLAGGLPLDDLQPLVEDLNRLARAEGFRLVQAPDDLSMAHLFELEAGFVVDHEARPVRERPLVTFLDSRPYVRLRNTSTDLLFLHLFDVGVAGRIHRVTTASPSGLVIKPGATHTVGTIETGALEGLQIGWPDGVPRAAPRLETFVVVVTAEPQDLRGVEQEGVSGGTRDPSGTLLQQRLDQLGRAVTRGTVNRGGLRDRDRFGIQHVDLRVYPTAQPRPETAAFVLDERPDLAVRLDGQDSPTPVGRLALWVSDMRVGGERDTDPRGTRLDVLAVTATGHRAATCEIGPQASRPEPLLVYDGPVAGHLDVAVWVSRPRPGEPDLAALLDTWLPDPPAAAPADDGPLTRQIAAVSTTARLVDTAAAALRTATDEQVGLYRSAFLPVHVFGAGRHPAAGAFAAADVSMALEIAPGDRR